MNTDLMKETFAKSMSGTQAFPEAVRILTAEGVESYSVDLIQNLHTSYMPNGEIHAEHFEFQGPAAALEFQGEKVIAAIRASQSQKIKFPEFLKTILEAGVTSYTVYLKGRKAIYFGRKGDLHIENFPPAL